MCTLLTVKANIWSRWPCFCQRMHIVHSAFDRNDLYIQLIGRLNYSERQNISTDGKFIMEKKRSPHTLFSCLPKDREVRQIHRKLHVPAISIFSTKSHYIIFRSWRCPYECHLWYSTPNILWSTCQTNVSPLHRVFCSSEFN